MNVYERWFYYACYEIAKWYSLRHPGVVSNSLYKRLLDQCFPCWVNVKTAMTMNSVYRQTAAIADQWKDMSSDPVYTEKPSQVEGLPEMRLRAPWTEE